MPEIAVNNRVRAVLLTGRNSVLLIKRIREGYSPYWVAPGGGVEETDASPEAALRREMVEELGATVDILRFAFVYEKPINDTMIIRQTFYLCRLLTCDPSQRCGPEFDEPSRGKYVPVRIPLTHRVLLKLNIKPDELKTFLLRIS